jgi:hypothetical protein
VLNKELILAPNQQHRIPIAEKPVFLRNRVSVQTHDVFVARKGAEWAGFLLLTS